MDQRQSTEELGISCIEASSKLIDDIKQIYENLTVCKKILDPFLSSIERMKILQQMKYEIGLYFSRYQEPFFKYKDFLEKIKKSISDLVAVEKDCKRWENIFYKIIHAPDIKRNIIRKLEPLIQLVEKYKDCEEQLKSTMLLIKQKRHNDILNEIAKNLKEIRLDDVDNKNVIEKIHDLIQKQLNPSNQFPDIKQDLLSDPPHRNSPNSHILTNISDLKLNHGLIINPKKIQASDFSACILKTQPEIIELRDRKFQPKLVLSSKYKDSFLLENHIDPSAINVKYLDWMNDANPLKNESAVKDVYLEIQNSRVELVFRKESIKPSEKLIKDIKVALNHQDPYRELMKVFKTYGYFLPEKVILGHKLYVMSHLITDGNSSELNIKNDEWTLDDFSSAKYNEFLNEWESHIKTKSFNFDSSYLVSIDGDIIMRSDIKRWVNNCSDEMNSSLNVISWKSLYPLYEILEESLCQEIKLILGNDDQTINSEIKAKVLMAGVISIKDSITYYRINFSHHLESKNYQLFGKLMTQSGVPIDDFVVKFTSMNIYGFSVTIENFDTNANIEKNLNNSQITWILIGIPSEVGIYSSDTRNFSLLCLGSHTFTPETDSEIYRDVPLLEVPKDLQSDAIFITSFVYPQDPQVNYEPCFMTRIKNYNEKGIEVIIDIKEDKIMDIEDESINAETNEETIINNNSKLFSDDDYNDEKGIETITYIKENKIMDIDDDDDYSDETSNESIELEYSFQWCILHLKDKTESDNNSANSIVPISHLKALGRSVGMKSSQSRLGNITKLDLSYNKLDSEPEMVVNILKSDIHVNHLDLSHNKFISKAGMALQKALKNNTTLSNLNLSNTNIDSCVGEALVDVLKNNKVLVNLNLSYNNLENKVIEELAKVLELNSSKIAHLNLSSVNLEFRGEIALAEALKSNKTLVSLNLSSNKIGSFVETSLTNYLDTKTTFSKLNYKQDVISCVTAKHLESALKENKTLIDLDISSNSISSEAGKVLVGALKQNRTLRSLNLKNNNIGSEAGEALAEILINTNQTLTSVNLGLTCIGSKTVKSLVKGFNKVCLLNLDLSYNNINPEESKALLEALETNTTLKCLNLSHNCMNLECGKKLAKSLKINKTLVNLKLIHCNISFEVVKILEETLKQNKTLTHLDLSNNNISFDAELILAKILEFNHALTNLNLSHNEFNVEAGEALARALEKNNTLTHLGLKSTIIEPKTGKALVKALEINKTLIELDLSDNNLDSEVGKFLAESLKANNSLKRVDISSSINKFDLRVMESLVKLSKSKILSLNIKFRDF
ncbi:15920_t:CDS:2 [Cetraspora pellucida]|uniref:15920_t:CDS:1 n=1 Tax=Cetraspora pellucida TaxID=1433469 RepID=A0A9N9DTX3_9GLOM|nr:15920_t:CDS:2 [Cetraspora pellucida]